ncbi:MAG: hypothetical protein NTX26_03680, partial [Candidatus Parcubacteria bacterium]|nr:hypothetical protein [Candidatus Parcubacteria bacterium]
MELEIPDIAYSDGECHMARIAEAATFVRQKMTAEGQNPSLVTFDSIFALAQTKNSEESKLTYP